MEEPKKNEELEKAKARQSHNKNLLNLIIAETFARHSKLNEEEFLKAIGFENSGKTEDEAIRIAMFNVLTEATNLFIKAKGIFNTASGLLRTYLLDEKIEEENKGE